MDDERERDDAAIGAGAESDEGEAYMSAPRFRRVESGERDIWDVVYGNRDMIRANGEAISALEVAVSGNREEIARNREAIQGNTAAIASMETSMIKAMSDMHKDLSDKITRREDISEAKAFAKKDLMVRIGISAGIALFSVGAVLIAVWMAG